MSQFVCSLYHLDGTKWEVEVDAPQSTLKEMKMKIEKIHGPKSSQQHMFVKGETEEVADTTVLDPSLHSELFVLHDMHATRVNEVEGDLLSCNEKYIVHNCHCERGTGSARARGLTKAIFDRYTYANVYASKKLERTPGTISVMGDGSARQRFVVNLYGQRLSGRTFNRFLERADSRPEWFAQGLTQLAQIGSELCSVAFPHRIGCQMLEGGDWTVYRQLIEDFAESVAPHGVSVTIYRPT